MATTKKASSRATKKVSSTLSAVANSNPSHIVIKAMAGTGKTSTMLDFLNLTFNSKYKTKFEPTPQQKLIFAEISKANKVCFCAFNKAIAEELKSKVPSNVEAKTLHALGMGILRNHMKIKVNADQTAFYVKEIMGYKTEDRMNRDDFSTMTKVKKVVGLLKGYLLDASEKNISYLVSQFGIDLGEDSASIKAMLTKICEITPKVMEKCDDVSGGLKYIDFDDMIYLPAKLGLTTKMFDLLIVDEAQDLNPAQHQIAASCANRVVLIGDDRQAIYGFRGSDSDSINNCVKLLSGEVKELKLTTTWRCPKSHVEDIKNRVAGLEDFTAAPNAIKGEIHDINESEMIQHLSGKSLVMCRTNAPLCMLAFDLIRLKKPVRIQGREFGGQLVTLAKKMDTGDDQIDTLCARLDDFENAEIKRISAANQFSSESQIQMVQDKCSCIRVLSEGMTSISELVKTIQSLFDDTRKKDQVLLSSIHRAKGLEADDIFIIKPQLMPHSMAKLAWEHEQEQNLIYVAHTRGLKRKFMVHEEDEK